jgi:hypothetical protein
MSRVSSALRTPSYPDSAALHALAKKVDGVLRSMQSWV